MRKQRLNNFPMAIKLTYWPKWSELKASEPCQWEVTYSRVRNLTLPLLQNYVPFMFFPSTTQIHGLSSSLSSVLHTDTHRCYISGLSCLWVQCRWDRGGIPRNWRGSEIRLYIALVDCLWLLWAVSISSLGFLAGQLFSCSYPWFCKVTFAPLIPYLG